MWPSLTNRQKTNSESSSDSGEIVTIELMSEVPLIRDRMKPSSGEKLNPGPCLDEI